MRDQFHGTTIIGIRKNGKAAIGGDGQLTLEDTIIKSKGRKVRKVFDGKVLTGYAGGAADALALLEIFENKLRDYNGDLKRAVIELAKEWRMDRNLRRLEAELIVMDKKYTFLVSGLGEIIEPDDDIVAIGSGGSYALAAARALHQHSEMPPRDIVQSALDIAADICVFTNHNISIEELEEKENK